MNDGIGNNHNINLVNFVGSGGMSSGGSQQYSSAELTYILGRLERVYNNVDRIFQQNSKTGGVGQILAYYEEFINDLSNSHMCIQESPNRLTQSTWNGIEKDTCSLLDKLKLRASSVALRIQTSYKELQSFNSGIDADRYPTLEAIQFGNFNTQNISSTDVNPGSVIDLNNINPPENNPTQDTPTQNQPGAGTEIDIANPEEDGSSVTVTSTEGSGSGGAVLPDSGDNSSGGQGLPNGDGVDNYTNGGGSDINPDEVVTDDGNISTDGYSNMYDESLDNLDYLGGAAAGGAAAGGLFDYGSSGYDTGYGSYDSSFGDYNYDSYGQYNDAYGSGDLFEDDYYNDLKKRLDALNGSESGYNGNYSNSYDYDSDYRNNYGNGSGSSSGSGSNWNDWNSNNGSSTRPGTSTNGSNDGNNGSSNGYGNNGTGSSSGNGNNGGSNSNNNGGLNGSPNGGSTGNGNNGLGGPTGGAGANPEDGSNSSKFKPGTTGGTSDWGGDGSTGNGGSNGYFGGTDTGNNNKKGNSRLPDVTVENVGLGSVTMAGAMGAGSAAAGMAGNGSSYTNSYVGSLGASAEGSANSSMGFAGNNDEEEKKKKSKYQFEISDAEIDNPDEKKQTKDIESVVVDTLEPSGVENLEESNMGTVLGLGGISAGLGIGGAYLSQAKKEAEEEEKKKQEKKNEETLGLVGGIIGASFISDDDDEDNKKKKKRSYFNNDVNRPDDINNFMRR